MRQFFSQIFYFFPVTLFVQSAIAVAVPKCDFLSKPKDVCSISLSHVRPSQFVVGQFEVSERSQKIKEMSPEKRDSYLAKHPVSIVVAPGGEIFIVNGHHLAKALLELNEEDIEAVVVQNMSQLDETNFEKEMLKNHWTWLEDENGMPKTFSELPRHLGDLKDDPYRSLAWLVRKADGYTKLDTEPWQDFLWADFLRKHVEIDASDRSFTRATQDSLKIAHSDKAAALPGYTKRFIP